MAFDLTNLFKENVKTIRSNSGYDKTKILNEQLLKKSDKTKKQNDNFSKEAKNIVNILSFFHINLFELVLT